MRFGVGVGAGDDVADVLVVGGGPAGLSAAITLASEGRRVTLLEKAAQVGGQAATSSLIENVPPFADGFSGRHFAEQSCWQCEKFGVDMHLSTEATGFLLNGRGLFSVLAHCSRVGSQKFWARAVLLAPGMRCRRLGVPGEWLPHIYHGMVSQAISLPALDAACGDGAQVVLIGGGNAVGQAALYYLGQRARVVILARRPLGETMSWYLLQRLHGRVDVRIGIVTGFVQVSGGRLRVLYEGKLGSVLTVSGVDCVHVLAGMEPATAWLRGRVALDRSGYIVIGSAYDTSQAGVFAVGDATHRAVRRLSCAIGDGNRVVPEVHRFLDSKVSKVSKVSKEKERSQRHV